MIAATLVLAVCDSAVAGADPAAPAPGLKTTMDHDGTFVVGADIVPGTYSSAGPVGSGTCYWKRMSSPTGGEILDNAISKQPQVVEILPTDAAFKTRGCQTWQVSDAAVPGGVPPLLAGIQLRQYMDYLNSRAPQAGAQPVPAG